MKALILSDHTTTMVMQAKKNREDQYSHSYAKYTNACSLRLDAINAQKNNIKFAWKNVYIFDLLYGLVRLCDAYLEPKPVQPVLEQQGKQERVWESGGMGERIVFDYLAERLDDDWTLISGYRNSKGEIDHVVVGPYGVYAIEIKYINGVVYCNGDHWWSDKYDNYGNLVEQGVPITDKRGRSPSKQLNDSANMLQLFLSKRCGIPRVHRSVILSYHKSRLGELSNITVDAIATVQNFDLARLFTYSTTILDVRAVDRVIQAIRKDHEFHEKPKSHRISQNQVA